MLSLVAVVGPTAVGKTEFALKLAVRCRGEIVNADSRQVYRGMDIGTGKPTAEQRARVPHHLFDVVNPDQDFSLAAYTERAEPAIRRIRERGNLPFLVGGTGQYVWSLLERWDVPRVEPDTAFRRQMEAVALGSGAAALHGELARIDPVAADRIQATNVRRVIRALEVHRATGEAPSQVLWRRAAVSADVLIVGLQLDRDALVARADARIDTMIRYGFADEVRALKSAGCDGSLSSMSSIGYREMFAYVEGSLSLEDAVAGIRRETRRLIRRQRAWFRADDERIHWLDYGDAAAATACARDLIAGRTR